MKKKPFLNRGLLSRRKFIGILGIAGLGAILYIVFGTRKRSRMLQAKTKDVTAAHHALLFAWLAKAVIRRAGHEKGEPVVRQAVQRYGEQRGRRMALRAQANEHALTMANYLAYNEWEAGDGEMEQKLVERTPDLRVMIDKCPWYTAWEENDLIPYGRFYCLDVDKALVQGFNPELKLGVNSTRTNGGKSCDLRYYNANFTVVNMLGWGYKKFVNPGKKAVMPWEYHVGHLFKTMGEVITRKLGKVGHAAVDEAIAEYAKRYGTEAAQKILAYRTMDFSHLPG